MDDLDLSEISDDDLIYQLEERDYIVCRDQYDLESRCNGYDERSDISEFDKDEIIEQAVRLGVLVCDKNLLELIEQIYIKQALHKNIHDEVDALVSIIMENRR